MRTFNYNYYIKIDDSDYVFNYDLDMIFLKSHVIFTKKEKNNIGSSKNVT